MLLSLAALITIIWLLSLPWWRKYARLRRMEFAIPGPPSLPLLGNSLEFIFAKEENVFSTIMRLWGGRHDELSRINFLMQLFVVVSDPDDISKVMRDRRFNNKSWHFYFILKDFIGEGLVVSNGALWKRHRTLIQPTFHLGILERFVEVFAEEAASFVTRMRTHLGRDVEFEDELYKTLAYTILRTTMSSSMDKTEEEVMRKLTADTLQITAMMASRSFRPWLWPSFMLNLTGLGQKLSKVKEDFTQIINSVINRKILEVTSSENFDGMESQCDLGFKDRQTFLDFVVTSKLSNKLELSEKEILDECRTLVGAAVETSASLLTFLFKMLSIRQDVQQRVYAEMSDIFHGTDRPVTSEDLSRMEYTECVIKETLRMFPIAPFLARHVQEDTTLSGKEIPAGSVLIINVFSAHRDPRHWPDPLTFDPDRFLPERSAGRHPYCYLPFSAGPRDCIGKKYAMMQMKTLLATVLRAYRLLPAQDGIDHPSQVPLKFDIFLHSLGRLAVNFESRTAPS